MKSVGEIGEAGWFSLDYGTNRGRCGDVGEPKVDVFFYNVVENGDSSLMGSQVLSKNGHADVCMSGTYVSKNIIKVVALMQLGGGIDVVD